MMGSRSIAARLSIPLGIPLYLRSASVSTHLFHNQPTQKMPQNSSQSNRPRATNVHLTLGTPSGSLGSNRFPESGNSTVQEPVVLEEAVPNPRTPTPDYFAGVPLTSDDLSALDVASEVVEWYWSNTGKFRHCH